MGRMEGLDLRDNWDPQGENQGRRPHSDSGSLVGGSAVYQDMDYGMGRSLGCSELKVSMA